MHARIIIVAAALLASGGAFAAEPATAPARPPESLQPQPHRAQLMLASADQRNSAPGDQQAQAAPRHARVARVTTCRCGDQPEQPDE